MGTVITFYSYKGGVGKTFLLANVGWLMAEWGFKVLCIDWDLKAPGLHHYLKPQVNSPGLVELLNPGSKSGTLDWRKHIIQVRDGLDLMPAGRQGEDYVRNVQNLNWEEIYRDHGFGETLENLRREWVKEYDFVLIDSQAGVTDIGGICAAQLPDILVFLFTANKQSLTGCMEAVQRARKLRSTLPIDRGNLLTLPVPSRLDATSEYKETQRWLAQFAEDLQLFYRDWLDQYTSPTELLGMIRVPYFSYWSFGEKLAVREELTQLHDPQGISYYIANIAALLCRRLGDSGSLVSKRNEFVKRYGNSLAAVSLNPGPRNEHLCP